MGNYSWLLLLLRLTSTSPRYAPPPATTTTTTTTPATLSTMVLAGTIVMSEGMKSPSSRHTHGVTYQRHTHTHWGFPWGWAVVQEEAIVHVLVHDIDKYHDMRMNSKHNALQFLTE